MSDQHLPLVLASLRDLPPMMPPVYWGAPELQSGILQIDKAIHHYQHVFQMANATNSALQRHRGTYIDALSRQSRPRASPLTQLLPLDILGPIFCLSIGITWETRTYRKAVMSVASVCRHWRYAALATRELWSCIYLHCTDGPSDGQVALATSWLDRSGGRPISFALAGTHVPHSVVDMFAAFSDRWKVVRLRNIVPKIVEAVCTSADGFPRLAALSVRTEYNDECAKILRQKLTDKFSPALRELDMRYCLFPQNCIPWHQLVELRLTLPHSFDSVRTQCVPLLQGSPRLEKLLVVLYPLGGAIRWQDIVAESRVRLTQLSHLEIVSWLTSHDYDSDDDADEFSVGDLLDYLELPALVHFTFRGSVFRDEPLIRFLERSPCSLRVLDICYMQKKRLDRTNWSVLDHVPDLESLHLALQSYTSTDEQTSHDLFQWDHLDVTHRREVYMPNLKYLAIDAINDDELNYRRFAEIVMSRWRVDPRSHGPAGRPVQRLRQVNLRTHDYPLCLSNLDDIHAIDLFRRMRSEGLVVVIADAAGNPHSF